MQNNKRLKILFLLQDIPFPVSDGMRWKVFHLLKYLSAHHQCDVIAFAEKPPYMVALKRELPLVNWLAAIPRAGSFARVWRSVLQLLAGRPASLGRFHSQKYLSRLQEAVRAERYDVLHFDIVNIAQYLREDIASVHSPNDATSLFYSRMAKTVDSRATRLRLWLGAFLLRRYERNTYPKFTKVHVVSQVDANYLKLSIPDADVVFIPFGVDVEQHSDNAGSVQEYGDQALTILILGGANVPGVASGIQGFVEDVMPRIAADFPAATFRIQGRETEQFLGRLNVAPGLNVHASNWVEDLDALIRAATVVVLPDKAGTGIKTRALQALACGTPIVGTKVAFEGLQEYARSGEHCMIAGDSDELASQLREILSDTDKRRALGLAATELARTQLSWSLLGPKYEAMYFDAVRKFQRRGMGPDLKSNPDFSHGQVADGAAYPRFSVCIPAYNRAALLPELLDSIFSQDYDAFEVVIVEDGSPERVEIAAVAHAYAEKYPGRLFYHENAENLGYDGNLRRLIEEATGDYVVFMGNDDLMAKGALSAMANAVRSSPQVGVILRSYSSFKTTPDDPVQTFRYFDSDFFFPAGAATITTFFRRCVFISGMVVRRESALAFSTDRFDGTLLYQQHLVGEILARENGIYLAQIVSYHRLGGTPDFGNSRVERGQFVPHEQTAESSVHFMRGMLSIAAAVAQSTGLPVYQPILHDIGNYAYPILAIQAQRPRGVFFSYVRALGRLGFWRVPLFYAYALGLFIFGRNACDRVIAMIKRRLGRAPKIGRVYSGQE